MGNRRGPVGTTEPQRDARMDATRLNAAAPFVPTPVPAVAGTQHNDTPRRSRPPPCPSSARRCSSGRPSREDAARPLLSRSFPEAPVTALRVHGRHGGGEWHDKTSVSVFFPVDLREWAWGGRCRCVGCRSRMTVCRFVGLRGGCESAAQPWLIEHGTLDFGPVRAYFILSYRRTPDETPRRCGHA